MFENTFNSIDEVMRNDEDLASELDYAWRAGANGQSSIKSSIALATKGLEAFGVEESERHTDKKFVKRD